MWDAAHPSRDGMMRPRWPERDQPDIRRTSNSGQASPACTPRLSTRPIRKGAILMAPKPESRRITRGDVDALLNAFGGGGRAILLHSKTAEGAPA